MTFEMTAEIIIPAANCVDKLLIEMKPTEIHNDENYKKVKTAFELVTNDRSKKLKNVSFVYN